MMNVRTFSAITICILIVGIFYIVPANPAAASDTAACHPDGTTGNGDALVPDPSYVNTQFISADADGDGLPDDVENGGWDNLAGRFVTDPRDADSDNDGLTDGEEKLLDTNPNDALDPGIVALYTNDLKTSKYFGWKKHGDRFIARNTVVIRRGSSFFVAGRSDGTLAVSTGGLSNLTVQGTNCNGRWKISVPSGGTVGKYTITLSKGSWQKSLTLDVIFELSTSLGDADRTAYQYSDDPTNTRDEWAIWFMPEDDQANQSASHPGYHYANGVGFAFQNDQYLAYVFQAHIMPAINGYSDPWSASNAVGSHVDQILRFEAETVPLTMYAALNSYRNQAQCSIHASVLTAFLRGAGIPSRPIAIDWDMSVRPQALMDTSTEVWLSGDWQVMRAWKYVEPYPGDMAKGIYPLTSRSTWGSTMYTPGLGDLLLMAGSNWVWDQVQTGWIAPNPLDYSFPNWQNTQIAKWDWVKTVVMPYGWGWPGEPQKVGGPYDVPYDVWPHSPSEGVPLSAQVVRTPTPQPRLSGTTSLQGVDLGSVLNDRGVDLNGNGRFDKLVIQVNVNVTQPGYYTVGGSINSTQSFVRRLSSATAYVNLKQGSNTVELGFSGQTIFRSMVDGPYRITSLWIVSGAYDEGAAGAQLPPLQSKTVNYQTGPYHAKDFEPLGSATLLDQYQEQGTQSRVTGRYQSLTIVVGFSASTAGTYTVKGSLYDKQGKLIQEATWSGTQSPALLQFDKIAGTVGPYQLKQLYLLDNQEGIIDSRDVAFTTQKVTSGADKTHIVTPPDEPVIGPRLAAPGTFADSGVDTNGDGLFEKLAISANVKIAPEEGGQPYRMEGWLLDQNASLVNYAISSPRVLAAGPNTLTLEFDGRIINEHAVDGPFTLVSLRILPGSSYQVLSEVPVAYTTSSYDHTKFTSTLVSPTRRGFADDMESGADKWVAGSKWSLLDNDWVAGETLHSLSHAWRASIQGSSSSSLTTKPVDLSDYAAAILRFKTCYGFGSSDRGYVEASNDGITWTPVLTFTGSTPHWATIAVDFSAGEKAQTMQLRFRAAAQSSLTWLVDDVFIEGVPSIKNVSFTSSLSPVLAGTDITFTGSYATIDPSYPVTYTWSFGDDTAPFKSSSPQATHKFAAPGDYYIALTVESPLDRTTTSRLTSVYQPVTLVQFTYSPPRPDPGDLLTFSAGYQPPSANKPITYTWTFGDGSAPMVTNQVTVTHTYAKKGAYPVTLEGTNGYGTPSTYNRSIGIGFLYYFLPNIGK